MPQLEIALLGAPEINLDGSPVKTDRRKAIALLAYLAVTNESHPRDELAALLWPDYERDSAYAYLRRTLWELNQMLGKGWIDADREHIALTLTNNLWLDFATFHEFIHAGEKEVDVLTKAVDLYRGDFLSGFVLADTAPFADWQFQQAETFRLEFADVLERLVDIHAQRGEYEMALPYARRWLALDQLNEAAHCAIMRLLAGLGDRAGLVRQYEACVQILKAELDIDPQLETRELYKAILHGKISGWRPLSEVIPQIDSKISEEPVFRLPVMPTPFIGRRPEVEQIKSLMKNTDLHLLTLIGPGGTGKTRLAIQAASEVGEAFTDGVFFAPLVSVHSAEELVTAVAKAIDFSFYREEHPRQQLLDYLCGRRLLLILDNFEHLLEISGLVGEMISNAPGVKLVVTSRIRLNVQGEQLYPVGGMCLPDSTEVVLWDDPEEEAQSFSAMQLFLECGHRVRPDFALTKVNVQSVSEICHLVEGMPLGLELAAAWVELLPPDEIAAEITRSLDFLETDQTDVPDRQRSIRAVFESSWKLLSKDEQGAFLSLCVFVGSFSRDAAQQVSGVSLRILLGLANKSWMQQTDGGRFQLHELMRQYGEERLKADKQVWRDAMNRHARYFAGFVTDQSLRMRSPEQMAGVRALAKEFDGNIKKAWDWLVSEQCWNDLIETMILGLFQFSMISWQTNELIPWFKAARLSLASASTYEDRLAFTIFSTLEVYCEENSQILDADPINRLSLVWQMVSHDDMAEAMGFWFVILAEFVRGRNLASDVDEQLEANITQLRAQKLQWQLGISQIFNATRMSDFVHDEISLNEAAKIFEDLGVFWEQGIVAEMLGKYAYQQRRPLSEVISYYDHARQFYQKVKDHSPHMGINMLGLVDIYFQQGKYEQGFAIFKEEQQELERMGQMRIFDSSKHWESLFAARYSTYEHALRLRQDSLALARMIGSQSDLAWRLFELGDVYRIFGESEKALDLFDEAHTLFEKMNLPLGLGFDQRARGDLALGEKRYLDALAHYQNFDDYVTEDNHIWGMTQSRARIALANAYLGNVDQARMEMKNALAKIYELREDDLTLQSILAEPVCLLQEVNLEGAIEFASFLQHQPASWNETKHHAGYILEMASQDLHQEVVELAKERGKTLDFNAVVAELREIEKTA
jgi:predicted ATPase/DNA-binding SARP family transcriptional activator